MTRRDHSEPPGWKRLWRHSYALGARWAICEAKRGWPARKVGLARLVVPLDPWRYYELGRVAEAHFSGRCLDVSSPKLLPSLLQAEGKGLWTCIDLFEDEIEAWRTIDPTLELLVQNATALSFADETFDHCICVSVLEHVGVDQDGVALDEIWRVLAPGGVLHLTTDLAATPRDVLVEEAVYGAASRELVSGGTFFKHDYSVEELDRLLSRRAWQVLHREFAAQRKPGVERWFYSHAPWSYPAGPFLRFVCPTNFDTSSDPGLIDEAGQGVVYMQLTKPAENGT